VSSEYLKQSVNDAIQMLREVKCDRRIKNPVFEWKPIMDGFASFALPLIPVRISDLLAKALISREELFAQSLCIFSPPRLSWDQGQVSWVVTIERGLMPNDQD
jgi:hypothetical protein